MVSMKRLPRPGLVLGHGCQGNERPAESRGSGTLRETCSLSSWWGHRRSPDISWAPHCEGPHLCSETLPSSLFLPSGPQSAMLPPSCLWAFACADSSVQSVPVPFHVINQNSSVTSWLKVHVFLLDPWARSFS